ncbi:nucleoside diphosphate kinase [Streptococcus pneumoniae]|nr:nucleoside diphosphate kinase [Streptococcus pneumoniae]
MEQTFFIIKPDGVKRGLVGEVLKRIEQRGFTVDLQSKNWSFVHRFQKS